MGAPRACALLRGGQEMSASTMTVGEEVTEGRGLLAPPESTSDRPDQTPGIESPPISWMSSIYLHLPIQIRMTFPTLTYHVHVSYLHIPLYRPSSSDGPHSLYHCLQNKLPPLLMNTIANSTQNAPHSLTPSAYFYLDTKHCLFSVPSLGSSFSN